MGIDPQRLEVRLVQFAILYRGSERVQMSTRSGSFVTLRELREEVGNDAARFFYVTRKAEQHMDFDLELAKSESKDNPVYYVQYAHARISSMARKLADSGESLDLSDAATLLQALSLDEEKDLATLLQRYPEVVSQAAAQLEPHQLTHYLRDLAGQFHTYYNAHKVLVDEQQTAPGPCCPEPGCTPGPGQRPGPARCQRAGRNVGAFHGPRVLTTWANRPCAVDMLAVTGRLMTPQKMYERTYG